MGSNLDCDGRPQVVKDGNECESFGKAHLPVENRKTLFPEDAIKEWSRQEICVFQVRVERKSHASFPDSE